MSGTEATASHARRTTALLGALLVLLIVALCAVSYFFVRILLPAGAPEPVVEQGGGLTWVRSIYGFGPSRDEQLLGPTDVAVAPNGRIHVTDPQRARVLTFNPDGTFAGIIHTGAGGTGRGQLGRPGSIACDADGNVYIADELNGKIIVFDKRARFVREWPVPGIANVDIAGDTLYARAGGEVVAFTFDGCFPLVVETYVAVAQALCSSPWAASPPMMSASTSPMPSTSASRRSTVRGRSLGCSHRVP